MGALHTDDASLQIGGDGEQAGKLAASSVTLDRDTSVGFEIRGTAPTPGVDYGEIVAHGPVNLATSSWRSMSLSRAKRRRSARSIRCWKPAAN